MKVSNLTPKQLDYLVCQLEKEDWYPHQHGESGYSPTTNWKQGGPIIERERIATYSPKGEDIWYSYPRIHGEGTKLLSGQTVLITAMRCYVASKLGDDVDIPKELI